MDDKDLKIEEQKEYEIGFLLRNDEALAGLLSAVKSHGAEITLEPSIRKIALAYDVEKESQAFFGFLHSKIMPSKISSINHDLETNLGVLRFLILTEPFTKGRAPSPRKTSFAAPTLKVPILEKSSLPLSNEALEKKIEEILQ